MNLPTDVLVSNEDLQKDIAALHKEVMNIPQSIFAQLGRIEQRQEGFGVELSGVRSKMNDLERYQREANGCMARMREEIIILKEHDNQARESQKASAAHWWDVIKMPLGIGIGGLLAWIVSGGMKVP